MAQRLAAALSSALPQDLAAAALAVAPQNCGPCVAILIRSGLSCSVVSGGSFDSRRLKDLANRVIRLMDKILHDP